MSGKSLDLIGVCNDTDYTGGTVYHTPQAMTFAFRTSSQEGRQLVLTLRTVTSNPYEHTCRPYVLWTTWEYPPHSLRILFVQQQKGGGGDHLQEEKQQW
ncbi:hypothetical protein ACFX1X_026266 [Malus domestica]